MKFHRLIVGFPRFRSVGLEALALPAQKIAGIVGKRDLPAAALILTPTESAIEVTVPTAMDDALVEKR